MSTLWGEGSKGGKGKLAFGLIGSLFEGKKTTERTWIFRVGR